MNVAHLLISQANLRPDAPALIEGSGNCRRQISFAELDACSGRCAGLLLESGVVAGDHVLVFVPMSIDLYLALIAIFRIGAIATFLDPAAGREHIRRCCELVQPAALIAISKAHLLRLTSPAIRKIPRKFFVGWPVPGAIRWTPNGPAVACASRPGFHVASTFTASDTPPRRMKDMGETPMPRDISGDDAGAPLCTDSPIAENKVGGADPAKAACSIIIARSPDDPALLTFTSGSTGNPKAAVRSHGFLAAQHASLQRAIELTAGEVDLATLPIFSLANLASGVTTVIADADLRHPGHIDAAPVLRQIVEHRITRCVASPALFERLIDAPNASASLATMRRVYTGGAPVFPRLMDRLARAMPMARIVAVYGSTEAEPIAHVAKDEISAEDMYAMFHGAGLLAGPPVADIDLRIIPNQWGHPMAPMTGTQFAERVSPLNAPGEIVVHGDHVLRGYLNGQGDETTKFRVDDELWHRTGDAGYLDERGRLWLLGRAEARINDEKGEIYPFAVECAASKFDLIARSALIQHEGKRMLVVETTTARRYPAEKNLVQELAWTGIDGNVCFIDRIPLDKRHNAKIDYPALRKILTGH